MSEEATPTVTGLRRWITYYRSKSGQYGSRGGDAEVAVVEVIAEIDDADKWPIVVRTPNPSEALETCRAHNAALSRMAPLPPAPLALPGVGGTTVDPLATT